MKTEREQLELAAKAAGYTIQDCGDTYAWCYEPYGVPDKDGEIPIFKWNPRHDDGDAFRLMVKLYSTRTNVGLVTNNGKVTLYYDLSSVSVSIDKDPLAATREAIFQAAVKIGEGME
jgi:hypothetical protein